MLFERQRAVKCYSEIYWKAVVFQFLTIPLDVELIVSLVIVKVEGTHLGLGRTMSKRSSRVPVNLTLVLLVLLDS